MLSLFRKPQPCRCDNHDDLERLQEREFPIINTDVFETMKKKLGIKVEDFNLLPIFKSVNFVFMIIVITNKKV